MPREKAHQSGGNFTLNEKNQPNTVVFSDGSSNDRCGVTPFAATYDPDDDFTERMGRGTTRYQGRARAQRAGRVRRKIAAVGWIALAAALARKVFTAGYRGAPALNPASRGGWYDFLGVERPPKEKKGK